MTDAEGESALESTASCGWRCAVQARFGVGIIVLVDITVGGVERGSFAQRVLVADPPEADRIIVPSGFPVVVADISVCVVERDEVFWRNRGGNAKLPLRAVIHSLTGCEGAILCVINSAISTTYPGYAEIIGSGQVPGVAGVELYCAGSARIESSPKSAVNTLRSCQ